MGTEEMRNVTKRISGGTKSARGYLMGAAPRSGRDRKDLDVTFLSKVEFPRDPQKKGLMRKEGSDKETVSSCEETRRSVEKRKTI